MNKKDAAPLTASVGHTPDRSRRRLVCGLLWSATIGRALFEADARAQTRRWVDFLRMKRSHGFVPCTRTTPP